ncbi:hypothetical protein, partial [Sphingomonas bacterium]|uniref:hypothetical protein n=1 Tax=Sphingomonas bacterium TaxID=1895847 RepID=UPI001575F401
MPRSDLSADTRVGSVATAALLAAAAIAGLMLRYRGIADEPLWLDEAYSAFAADHGWRFLWRVVPKY